ncbi:MAG: uracil-DNA glycosylase [Bacteroidetes bacterium]|nr:MAG: uracil-DNA glycosylase [Bacteroidota bacterium]TAG88498.1 MAG: uracil-DNA glycosylase [Bacteroidota bacterium]
MDVKIESSWKERLKNEFEKDYFIKLTDFLREEYKTKTIFPAGSLMFNAFEKCPFDQVKVVILGQDPYHGEGEANGLCFSVNDGIKIPPSLRNIFKEILEDIGKEIPKSGNLERWANQGVFLLNATLTVVKDTAGSHQKKGWEEFTDAVIKKISDEKEGVVFMLWGKYAHEKGKVIDEKKHLVLKAPHPSPLAKGFNGNKHFSQANEYLKNKGENEIQW